MISKEKLVSAINRLPDNFSIEDVLDEILLLQKIERGLEQSSKNDVIADEDLSNQLPSWLT